MIFAAGSAARPLETVVRPLQTDGEPVPPSSARATHAALAGVPVRPRIPGDNPPLRSCCTRHSAAAGDVPDSQRSADSVLPRSMCSSWRFLLAPSNFCVSGVCRTHDNTLIQMQHKKRRTSGTRPTARRVGRRLCWLRLLAPCAPKFEKNTISVQLAKIPDAHCISDRQTSR